MRILITGFDSFGGENINPSNLAINKLPNKLKNIEIKKVTLPTVFKESSAILEENIYSFNTVERVAINIDDARIADNKNNSPIDEPIRKDGETAYFSTLPIKALVAELTKNNIPAAISNTAGTFVCNHIMYETLYLSKTKFNNISAGFIHIPYIREQVKNKPNTPFMELEMIIDALKIIIETSAEFYQRNDIKITGGYEH